jgi:hypothetical protein
MARHVRTSNYGDGMFYFTQPVGAGGGYGDGMFYFTQPVGAGGAYGDGGFFFTQPVGAPSGYGAAGFRHPAASRAGYGVVPAIGRGAVAGRFGGGKATGAGKRLKFARASVAGAVAPRFGAGAGGAGASISKAELDEVAKLAKELGKTEYWYGLRTGYLNPSNRTVEGFPVVNSAGKAEGDLKPRNRAKLSDRSKREIEVEGLRRDNAAAALNAKLLALQNRGISAAQISALDAFVKQARRVGAFDEIFRGNAKYRSYPNSPTLYKLILTDAGLKYENGERELSQALEVAQDYFRLSPMTATPTADFVEKAADALQGEGIKTGKKAQRVLGTAAVQESFPPELNFLRGSVTQARALAEDAFKAARSAVEAAPSAAAPSYQPSDAAQPTAPAEEEAYTPAVTPAGTPGFPETGYEVKPVASPVSEDIAKEESFFDKYKTPLLVGGAVAALILFRKQLGLGGAPASAKE